MKKLFSMLFSLAPRRAKAASRQAAAERLRRDIDSAGQSLRQRMALKPAKTL